MENCSDCFHGHIMLTGEMQAGQMICRRNPPTPYPLMQQNKNGSTSLQIIPLWSIVTKNDVCGEWAGVDEEETPQTPQKPAEKPKIILD